MAKNIGVNNNSLKQQNRGLILKLIATGECASRIELAKRTGLSKMSITNIINEFMAMEIVEEQDVQQSKGQQGRHPICLSIGAKAPKIIGLLVHRDECVAVRCDLRLQVLKRSGIPMAAAESGRLSDRLCGLIDDVMPSAKEERVWGIGIGSIGPVDIKQGMLLNPPNFFGIRDFEIVARLRERYGLPVSLDSQYNCAALAEKYFGIGKQYHDFIFVGIMNGIGSGIISDERIFRNSNGLTSELGHISVDWQGNACSCGNRGCLETYTGTKVMEQKLRMATGEDLDFRTFCEKAGREEDPVVDAIFLDAAEKMACALTSMVNLLNPQAIIIGHEGVCIPEKYLRYMEERINRQKLSGQYRQIAVKKSSFGEEAHLQGCACGILNRVFEGERTFWEK